ncbi:hypothetical protein ATANTOWER_028832 [Ataeniobius toweri]|uniref:Uncharacterized protein n=1 Tax=Ataeniobius toweri TaxID=208326 RepID=A0ABU7BVU9_9TELE|nr:hypothetical protein [Ataeniobius toweri]
MSLKKGSSEHISLLAIAGDVTNNLDPNNKITDAMCIIKYEELLCEPIAMQISQKKKTYSIISTLHFISLSPGLAFLAALTAFAFERWQHLLAESAVMFAAMIR